MLHYKRKKPRKSPAVSTSALPDIVFILLFFFMTVVTIKNQNLMVDNTLPWATEVDKLDKTDRIIEIFVGKPTTTKDNSMGESARIQMDDRFVALEELSDYALKALAEIPEHLRKVAVVSIKADSKVRMGLISDIKKELQEVNLLKINYTTIEAELF